MKQAVGVQKVQMKKLDMDQIEDLHEDMADMMADQQEIQEVLGRDYALEGMDENELAQELDELDEDIVNEKMEGVGSVPSYVSQKPQVVPQKAQPVANKDEQDLADIMKQ